MNDTALQRASYHALITKKMDCYNQFMQYNDIEHAKEYLCEVLGMACMAFLVGIITLQEWEEINTKTNDMIGDLKRI